MCQSEGTHQVVLSFLPPAVGCFLKKRLTKGRGAGVTGTILATPLVFNDNNSNLLSYKVKSAYGPMWPTRPELIPVSVA